MDWPSLLSVLAALLGGGGVAAIITARAGARKADVDALSTALQQMQAENKRLWARVEELEKQRAGDQAEIDQYQRKIRELEDKMSRMETRMRFVLAENEDLKEKLKIAGCPDEAGETAEQMVKRLGI